MLRRLVRLAGALLLGASLTAFPAYADAMPAAVSPESGWWWTPEEPGRGIAIEASGASGFFAGILAYAEDGTPTWQLVDGTGHAALQTDDPPAASFTFDSPRSGTMIWAGGRTPIKRYDIVPGGVATVPAAGTPRAGWWFNGGENGAGFFLEAQGGTLFLLAAQYDGLGRPVWYIAQGAMTTPTLFQGELTEVSGGQTPGGAYRPPSRVVPQGPIILQITDSTRATVTIPDGRQIPLVRYGTCLEVQRLSRPSTLSATSFPGLPTFPWPTCGGPLP